jgi:hydroxysqualene dehydroxylase
MPGSGERLHLAVVGAGWAGLAAAVRAVERGARVTLIEMSRTPGGRARTLGQDGQEFDNGQHILIGAYSATLALMRRVGASPEVLFWRGPLTLTTPDGDGLALPPGPPLRAFVSGLLRQRRWRLRDRLAVLSVAMGWRLRRFECPEDWTVARLCVNLPGVVQEQLIDPLCVAALNTPMDKASARVFLRVLQDALFGGPGSADLLLPRAPLSRLLPEPAIDWLQDHGVDIHHGRRVQQLTRLAGQWQVDGEPFDRVVLACTATEAARLAQGVDAAWCDAAQALQYQPIATVWLHDDRLRLRGPMAMLPPGSGPAQFVFDLRQLGQPESGFAFVASAASPTLAAGLPAATQAVVAQARQCFPGAFGTADTVLHFAAERRATFACTPALQRPRAEIAAGLMAAGDYVAGPYPATLEGAVRAGLAAAEALS